MHTPYGKDVLRQLRQSCDKYGLRLGVYLSPLDRNAPQYGTDSYNDFFVAQLTELCSGYGELFEVWFDGACGEGKNGKKQRYDWQRYYRVIRQLQPQAVIAFSGPDVRWIGNEGGNVRESEWSVVGAPAVLTETVAAQSQTDEKDLTFDRCDPDLGSRDALKGETELIWSPAEQAQSYALYRSMNGGKPELIKILTDYSYTDTGLDFLGNDYSYSVASLMTLPNSEKTVRSELSDSAQVEKISTVQNGAELNGVGYTITPDGAVVTGYKGRATALTIPPTIPVGNKTYTVIGIGPDVFRGNKTLKTISLPNTIRVIETGAFAYCNAMIDH